MYKDATAEIPKPKTVYVLCDDQTKAKDQSAARGAGSFHPDGSTEYRHISDYRELAECSGGQMLDLGAGRL